VCVWACEQAVDEESRFCTILAAMEEGDVVAAMPGPDKLTYSLSAPVTHVIGVCAGEGVAPVLAMLREVSRLCETSSQYASQCHLPSCGVCTVGGVRRGVERGAGQPRLGRTGDSPLLPPCELAT